MTILVELFSITVYISLILELLLITLIVLKRRSFLSEGSRVIFENNLKTASIIIGLMLGSLIIHFSAEVFELLSNTTAFILLELFHTIFLDMALLIALSLTYRMGWGD